MDKSIVKKKLHILYSGLKMDGNELAFLFPILFNKKRLKNEFDLEITLFDEVCEELFAADSLLVSSWYFGRKLKSWVYDKCEIFEFLKEAKKSGIFVTWADISDSTGTTQFEVMPYVDKYIKGQILKDRSQYKKEFVSARIHSDFYSKNFEVKDIKPTEDHFLYPLEDDHLSKLHLGWNTGLSAYNRIGPYYNLLNYKIFNLNLPLFYPFNWTEPSVKRDNLISCRLGTNYPRETITFQRKKVKELLAGRVATEKVSRADYFKEMNNSIVSVSPFGLGEISLRDFEIIVSGGLILKQNCDHMETWPNIFKTGETYLDFKWDFSDFEEVIDIMESKISHLVEMSTHCQRYYKDLLKSDQGSSEFCTRLLGLIS